MKTYLIFFLASLFSIKICGQSMNIPVIPVPQQVKMNSGFFEIPNEVSISFPADDSRNLHTTNLISSSIHNRWNKTSKMIESPNTSILLSLVPKSDKKFSSIPEKVLDQAYFLSISQKQISVLATNSRGLFYGAMSLIQLIDNTSDNRLTSMEILDYPDMEFRAVSDDISRGQVSNLENFKKIISHISRYKMNTYLPYLEDMIEFDKYPSIGKDRGALTKSEIKEIVSFANLHFVEVIPVFQTLGHYENILSLPEFIQYAEYPGAASLCVSEEKVYSFLEDLLKEVFPLFPSRYFHMGADESYDVGHGKSKELLDKSNIASLHANHYKRVYDICKAHGKEVMMYGDIILDLPEILDQIPKDITIIDWHYRSDFTYPSTTTFNKHGFNYLVSPSVWNFVTTFPTLVNSMPNIYYMIKSGLENNALGIVNSNWGDYGAETLKELILYGYAYSAQCSWSFSKTDLHSFSGKYFNDFFGVENSEGYRIYNTLGNPQNQMMWHEVWRHPLLPQRNPSWWESNPGTAAKYSWLTMSVPALLSDIASLKQSATRNKDHLEILEFYTSLNSFFALKLETQAKLREYKQLSNDQRISLIPVIDKNIEKINNLKQSYRSLWLRYYKVENLYMIEDKFDRLFSYFSEVKDQLQTGSGSFPYNPSLKTDWLYVKVNNDSLSSKSEFMSEFGLDKLPTKAIVQLMGDSHAKLFINDKFVDEVFVRRSLSLYTEYKRTKWINILDYLKVGKNTLRIEVINYNPRGSAGFNLASYLKDCQINLDSYASDIPNNAKWFGRELGKIHWIKPVAKKYPYEVIAPDFSRERKSWIER